MNCDLAYDWSLHELGALAECSTAHLTRLFKRHYGVSAITWLAQRRGEIAAVLLLTTRRPIAAIGATVGWADGNYFARRFRSLFGTSPSAYRMQLPLPPRGKPSQDWIQW